MITHDDLMGAVATHREEADSFAEDGESLGLDEWLTMEGIDHEEFKQFIRDVLMSDPRLRSGHVPDAPSMAFGFALGWTAHRDLAKEEM